MAVINGVNVTQVSTNTPTLVAGSIISTMAGTSLAVTVVNSGADTITWILYAGFTSDLSDKVAVKAGADILTLASDSYSVAVAPFNYYGVFIESKVDDTPGTAVVRAFVKG